MTPLETSRIDGEDLYLSLDTGRDIVAVTAKHVLTYFKSPSMASVSFCNGLKSWIMFPKNSPADVVEVEALINEESQESIDRAVPSTWTGCSFPWEKDPNRIQPLKIPEPSPCGPGRASSSSAGAPRTRIARGWL